MEAQEKKLNIEELFPGCILSGGRFCPPGFEDMFDVNGYETLCVVADDYGQNRRVLLRDGVRFGVAVWSDGCDCCEQGSLAYEVRSYRQLEAFYVDFIGGIDWCSRSEWAEKVSKSTDWYSGDDDNARAFAVECLPFLLDEKGAV